MHRLFVPSWGPSDWRRLLANPAKQWRRGRSAYELATCWEAARRHQRGLPRPVAACLDQHDATRDAKLVVGLPELQVEFPGGGHHSQTDFWALLTSPGGLISMSVEAKAGESFDLHVEEWLADAPAGSGKPARLAALREILGLAQTELPQVRYQLLHRAAAALQMAQECRAAAAIVLIQAFGGPKDEASRRDFEAFAELMLCPSGEGSLRQARQQTCIPLLVGWLNCSPADEATLADAL